MYRRAILGRRAIADLQTGQQICLRLRDRDGDCQLSLLPGLPGGCALLPAAAERCCRKRCSHCCQPALSAASRRGRQQSSSSWRQQSSSSWRQQGSSWRHLPALLPRPLSEQDGCSSCWAAGGRGPGFSSQEAQEEQHAGGHRGGGRERCSSCARSAAL